MGQSSTGAGAAGPDLSQNDVVVEKLAEKMAFAADGTHTYTQYQRTRVQSEAGVQSSGLIMVPFASGDEVKFDYVKVIKPDGKALPVGFDDMQEVPAPITQQAPMYSDLRVKHLPVPNLRPGDILEFQYTIKNVRALIPDQFSFEYKYADNYVVLDSLLEMSWPISKLVIIRVSDKFKPEISEANGRKSYIFHYRNLTVPDAGNKKAKDAAKKAAAEDPERANRPDILLTSFASWKETAGFFAGVFSERAKTDAEITAKALALVKDKQSDDEKINAIYRYVAQEYRYIGISLGIGRYQPHAAEAVFNNHFGDCKDKHTLLATMLAAAGYKAYPLLINGSGRKLNAEVPSPSQFDHVITAVDRGGKWEFLDSTPELAPAGELAAVIRGAKGLLAGGEHSGELLETPADPPFPLHREMSVKAEVNDLGKINAKFQNAFRNDEEMFLRQAFNDTPRTKWNELAQQISYAMGYSGDLENVIVSDPLKLESPFTLSYDYSRQDYVAWSGVLGDMRIPLGPIMDTSAAQDKDRTRPVELGSPVELHFTAKVKPPQGTVAAAPAAVNMVRDFGDYHARYIVDHGTLTVDRTLTIKAREVPTMELESYRQFCKAVDEDYNLTLQIRRTSSSSIGAETTDADELAEGAANALRNRDGRTALTLAKRLMEVKPDYHTAWLILGQSEIASGDADNAIIDFRKQLEVDAKDEKAGLMLGMALAMNGNHVEAIQALQNHLKNHPDDLAAKANLGSEFFYGKRYSDAVPILDESLTNDPGNPAIQFMLAKCYMGNHDAKAMPLLDKLADENVAFVTKNDLAYSMATFNYEIKRANEWVNQYLHLTTHWSAGKKLDAANAQELLRNTDSIAAAWSTLGYLYFLQGDTARAIDYLEGSWTLAPKHNVGEHLAMAYGKAGDDKDWQRIIASLPDAEPSPESPAESFATFHQGKFFSGGTPQDTRTIQLHLRRPKSESAEFLISLLPGGRADEVAMISGAEGLRELSGLLMKASYPVHIPAASDVVIVRRGILSCGPYTDCVFVLYDHRNATAPVTVTLSPDPAPDPNAPTLKHRKTAGIRK